MDYVVAIKDLGSSILSPSLSTSISPSPRLLLLSADGSVLILDVEGVVDAAIGVWTVMTHIPVMKFIITFS